MQFPSPLLEGVLVKRYKRFLADIQLSTGEFITAHCPNSGALLGGTTPGLRVWVSYSDDKSRKLPYTWQLVEIEGGKVGVNTHLPNKLVQEAFLLNKIPELSFYESLKPEVRYGTNSRIDFLLQKNGSPDGYLEIKNVHYKKGEFAYFPDCVTARGAKHLKELSLLASQGVKCFVFYVLQVEGCHYFDIAREIDPVYARGAKEAKEHGVEFLAYSCALSLEEIFLEKKVKVL